MIDVNKYKLDDDSNDEESLNASQTFKANKAEVRNSIDNVYNNNYKQNNLKLIEKKNLNNQKLNEDQVREGNNKYSNNKNYKYLVDDSTSKIHNENDPELNNMNFIKNLNQRNFLAHSTNEDNFGLSNDKNNFDRSEISEVNNNYRNNVNKKNNNENNVNDQSLENLNFQNNKHLNSFNNNVQKSKNKKDFDDKSLELQNLNNSKNDEEEFFNRNANFHHVQIIDEDVENFKRKIDILVKNFKTDSLKDFMSIKRHLLIEQKNTIEAEKQKCDALVGAKTDQIEHLKENLEKTRTALNKEIEIKEKLSMHLYNYRTNKKNQNLKKNIFAAIKDHYVKKKNNKRITIKIRGLIMKHLKERGFKLLDRNRIENKTFNTILAKENEFKNKLNEMGQFYGKEISDLKAKLAEANASIEKYKENKIYLQENLKRALMRGVVAMNLEAMNILEPETEKNNNNMVLNMANNMVDLNYFNKMSFNEIPNFNNTNPNANNNAENNILNMNNSGVRNGSENQDFNYTNTNKQMKSNIESQNNSNSNINYQPEILEKKNVIKDNKWINACSVPEKMKNNIVGNEIEEFEEKNIPIKVPMTSNTHNKVQYRNNVENNFVTEASPIDFTDELTKNLSSLKSDFKNLVKSPVLNTNFINNSYSNIVQNTDNSNINSINYPNLLSNNNQIKNNNLNNNTEYSNINHNLFRNNINNNAFTNNSFDENNSTLYDKPNNVLIKTPHFNQNGIVVNVKSSIQNQNTRQDDNVFTNNFAMNTNSNSNIYVNNSLSTQPNSNNKRINAQNTPNVVTHHTNSNSVNYNSNDKSKIVKKPSLGKLDKPPTTSKLNSTINKNEIKKK